MLTIKELEEIVDNAERDLHNSMYKPSEEIFSTEEPIPKDESLLLMAYGLKTICLRSEIDAILEDNRELLETPEGLPFVEKLNTLHAKLQEICAENSRVLQLFLQVSK